MKKETPKQFSARHLRLAIERAKVAVMDAQEEATNYRGNPADYVQLFDSAFSKLDKAWGLAFAAERHEKSKK